MAKRKGRKKKKSVKPSIRKYDGMTLDEIYSLSCKVSIKDTSKLKIIQTTIKKCNYA